MARPQGMSNKRDKEKQRQKEKQEKREKMLERKANQGKKSLDDMMAYLDEDGNITSVPQDPEKKKVFNVEDIQIGVPKHEEVDDPLREGKIDYFDGAKGFGFIIQNNGEKIFFHINQATYQVREGDIVNYTVERGPKGWNAVGVTKRP